MKNVLKYLLRGFTALGFVVFMVSALGWAALLTHEKPHLPERIILSLDLTHEIGESDEVSPLKTALGKTGEVTLQDAVAALDMAANDPRVKVLVGNFRENAISMAGAQELRDAIYRLREHDKPSYAFATSYGEFSAADKAYYVASAFEHIWLQPMGLVGITGLAAQSPFVRSALEKMGAKADFVHREEYKSAMDMLTQDDYTDANAEMMGSILDDLSMQMVTDIAQERSIEPLVLQQLIDMAPLSTDIAYAHKLVTHIGYLDELEDELATTYGENIQSVSAQEYLNMRRTELYKNQSENDKKPVVAFIHATGEIAQSAGGVTKSDVMAADTMVGAFQDAMEDEQVEAIVLRIDSPGGSAVASETIRRAIEKAQDMGLPVIVSMGEVAASGGYWMAAQADAIFADPATLTGSIGVIAGKVTGTPELWDKLGIHWGMITRGENADLWTATQPFTDAQRNKVDALVGETYVQFKQHVGRSRDLSDMEVAAVAKGRVWTGNQAVNNGLVDELGGLVDAINYTKSVLGVSEDDRVMLKVFPAPETIVERLLKTLDQFSGASVSALKLNILLSKFEAVLAPIVSLTNAKPIKLQMQEIGSVP
jgi:protease IV